MIPNRYSDNDIQHDEALWEIQKRIEYKNRFETVLRIYTLFGVLLAVFSVAYLILTTLDIQLTASQLIVLVSAGVGFLLALSSRALLLIRRERHREEVEQFKRMQDISDFLRTWSKFETVSKQKLEQEHRDFNKHSIREVIDLLHSDGKLDDGDVRDLEQAIQVRNSVVHRGDALSAESARKLVDVLTSVIQKVLR